MKKLCFGTLFTLLIQIKNGSNQQSLYRALVKPTAKEYDPDIQTSDISRRKSGKIDIPSYDKAFFLNEANSIENIVLSYRKILSKQIKNDESRNAFVIAIQDILKEDTTIDDNVAIGTYTKESILKNTIFDFFVLVANLMKYCASITNSNCTTFVKEITNNFVKERTAKSKNIELKDISFIIPTPLKITINDSLFADTFEEVNPNTYSLNLANENKVRIFKLKVSNNQFEYSELIEFIQDNIAYYVYSRTKRKDLESKGKYESVGVKAVAELSKSKYRNSTDNFCEIMLYSFLECSMKSPKILSGFEVNKNTSNSNSAGIYLLPAGSVSPNNQIIFGCSKAHADIKHAIDDAIEQAYKIKNGRNNEIKLLDPTILRANLEFSVAEYVRDIIIPHRNTSQETDDAYGIFISYTINVSNKANLSNNQYRAELDKEMDKDILNVMPYIKSKIDELGLNNYSFYFFILPLNNAETDPQNILYESTGVTNV